jgi:hypothetical protein
MWMVQIGDIECTDEQPHARISSLDELVPALRSLALLN